MTDLIEFLTTRLDEDEKEALDVLGVTAPLMEFGLTYGLAAFVGAGSSTFPSRHWSWAPARVLAEIAAKRAILALHAQVPADFWRGPDSFISLTPQPDQPTSGCTICANSAKAIWADGDCETVLALVQPFTDHPDYDPKWAE